MRRKEERSKQGQTNNKAKQHSTPKAVTFPKKNELPHMYMYARDIACLFLSSHLSLKTCMLREYTVYSLSHKNSMLCVV